MKPISPKDLLRNAREERGLTQRQLAQHIGVVEQTISSWERGTRFPSVRLRARLCTVLQKSPEELGFLPGKQEQKKQEAAPQPDTNRHRMLMRVRARWITGVLEHSLHQTTRILLELQEQPDAVANPWRLTVQETNRPPSLLPDGTAIVQVYDETKQLLILGEPGAGKTTLLLELARELLERAEHDDQHSIPVVFNLSSWALKQQPLKDWVIEEISTKYSVPIFIGQAWIDTDQLLVLLDGLDEVAEEARSACIKAINVYLDRRDQPPLVVCCRYAEYLAQEMRLALSQAVVVLPLTTKQIDAYLSHAGNDLVSVRNALDQDREFRAMIKTPLMLNIITLAYQGAQIAPLTSEGSIDKRRQGVFAVYIQRMMSRRGIKQSYSQEQTIHWLAWLARQLNTHNQTEFYLERMQPDWLPDVQAKRQHQKMVVILIYGMNYIVIAGLLGIFRGGQTSHGDGVGVGLLGWLGAGPSNTVLGWMAPGLGAGISGAGILALIFGLISTLIGVLSSDAYGKKRVQHNAGGPSPRVLQSLIYGLRSGILSGMIIGICSWLLFTFKYGFERAILYGSTLGLMGGLNIGLLGGLFARLRPPGPTKRQTQGGRSDSYLLEATLISIGSGLSFGILSTWIGVIQGYIYGTVIGIFGGLLFWWDRRMGSELTSELGKIIRPAEMLAWSWRSVKQDFRANSTKALSLGFIMMISVAVVIGVASGLLHTANYGIIYGIVYGPIVGVTIAVASILMNILKSGWSSEILDEHLLLRPNEGIRRSRRNGLFAALLFGPLGGLAGGAIVGLTFGLVARLSGWFTLGAGFAIVFSIVFALNFWEIYGGSAYIEHVILRLRLWKEGKIPRNYEKFLNYSVERILLRKVGGGYIFIHRLLQDYFASLDSTLPIMEKEAEL